MKILSTGVAGTLESCDAMITVTPCDEIRISLNSPVIGQFGDAIYDVVRRTLAEMQISGAHVEIEDKGAFDCVIRARLQAAVCRASGSSFDWEGEDGK